MEDVGHAPSIAGPADAGRRHPPGLDRVGRPTIGLHVDAKFQTVTPASHQPSQPGSGPLRPLRDGRRSDITAGTLSKDRASRRRRAALGPEATDFSRERRYRGVSSDDDRRSVVRWYPEPRKPRLSLRSSRSVVRRPAPDPGGIIFDDAEGSSWLGNDRQSQLFGVYKMTGGDVRLALTVRPWPENSCLLASQPSPANDALRRRRPASRAGLDMPQRRGAIGSEEARDAALPRI